MTELPYVSPVSEAKPRRGTQRKTAECEWCGVVISQLASSKAWVHGYTGKRECE